MARVILSRADEVVKRFPFPRAPKPRDITLFIAGHGTVKNENSRRAIERQAELIRAMKIYAAVHAIFLEESPRIGECYSLAQTRNLVVVPFFISDGLHTRADIPVLLGEAKADGPAAPCRRPAGETPALPGDSWGGGQGLGLRQTADWQFENPHLRERLHGRTFRSAKAKRRLWERFSKTQSRKFRRHLVAVAMAF